MKRCFKVADILLPNFEVTDPARWAVVACDQYTSQPEYWQAVQSEVGDAPSTLNLILPEVYLNQTDTRVPRINSKMCEYQKNVLVKHENSAIFVERVQSDGSVRRGVVMAIDLECYDYTSGSSALIRATEATVLERIPPRVAVRRTAELELPHVMLLIDDPKRTVIEPLITECDGKIAYKTELMLGGGSICGRFLTEENISSVQNALDALVSEQSMEERYGDKTLSPLLFAVGDGNHSLATAKACYEEIKQRLGKAAEEHPARYALVEIVNIHDDALRFEPIYRVAFNVDTRDLLNELHEYISGLDGTQAPQSLHFLTADDEGDIQIPNPQKVLTVATLQDFLDKYLSAHNDASVDYIHGEQATEKLSKSPNTIGFIYSGMQKDQLFKTVIYDGALPRKTFSMGHAEDKRYYMECRKITMAEGTNE